MSELWFDVINSDWRGYRGGEPEQDRLFQPGWIEQVMARWGIQVTTPLEADALVALQALRSLMQRLVAAFSEGHALLDQDVEALNSYLAAVPSTLHLVKKGETYQLEQVPIQSTWQWFLREIAASFATVVAQGDPSCLKRCSNPACRWVYYDESRKKNRRWCTDTCANLMRVRRFRAHHQTGSSKTST